ncbi:Homeodomain-like protein [Cordyceps fumosorosea ARSEF 2679]|uniref:Homeodomain-like protein n=1 Tax=Cordyceps fumosorosea (strain ARSEF 2679) TaxID=1081104 RepID=A0A167H650_CORFA|nr:Homeodomain-like protein [Cordyceps fumosorosea ARSEF 2679]OAA47532.1 Homeodomain-like protein [Cordyceps fumosorosea ARSEF 2679]
MLFYIAPNMAPRLSKLRRNELQSIILSKLNGDETIKDQEIARTVINCDERSVRRARSNIIRHATIDAPSKPVGRPREITENMMLALQAKLLDRASMSHQALADYLFQEYGVRVSRFTVGRLIKRMKWSRKKMAIFAKEQNPILRDDYIYRRSLFEPTCMVFLDESGDDRSVAIPKKGYAPIGVTPVQKKPFHRGNRVSFLPAYSLDGVLYCEVYDGHTDLDFFEGYLLRLLPYLGRYPGPRSVIFMDNASFHNVSLEVQATLAEAGVLLVTQPPYSPDLNPIEYFFGSLKQHIAARALEHEDLIKADFKSYLRMQINILGRGKIGKRWARGHFRKAQIYD